MGRKLSLMLLVCLTVVSVKSEYALERDENGVDYEVKRFNIQGRQLNENNLQCVITRRRKRSDDITNTNSESKYSLPELEQVQVQATTAVPSEQTNEKKVETAAEHTSEIEVQSEKVMNNKKQIEAIIEMNAQEMHKNDKAVEDNEAILTDLQTDSESAAALDSATQSTQLDRDNVILLSSHLPPKVNPATHAVFQLVPVQFSDIAKDEVEDDVDDEEDEDEDEDEYEINETDDIDFNVLEEFLPTAISDIWYSTSDSLKDEDSSPTATQQLIRDLTKSGITSKNTKKKTISKSKHKSPSTQGNNMQIIDERHEEGDSKHKKQQLLKKGHAEDVNCIIIEKDILPFYRHGSNKTKTQGSTGLRKRVNIRFVA